MLPEPFPAARSFVHKLPNQSPFFSRFIIIKGSLLPYPRTSLSPGIVRVFNEYLLNRCTLSKVLGVKIEGNTAVITTVLIPKHIWDKKQHIETPKKSY